MLERFPSSYVVGIWESEWSRKPSLSQRSAASDVHGGRSAALCYTFARPQEHCVDHDALTSLPEGGITSCE